MCARYSTIAASSATSGNWMIAAASRATPSSSGAIALAGALTVYSDSVGMRLISRAAMATVHAHTTYCDDHHPSPHCR